MTGEDPKSRPIQGLDLFHAMYVVGLALGLEQLTVALYKNLAHLAYSPAAVASAASNVLLFAAILLLVIRLFWSTGNIRRAWERADDHSSRLARFYVIFHLPALLIQGALVLFLCLAFAEQIESGRDSAAVMLWFVLVTAWNAVWLIVLTQGKERRAPELLWILNNLIFVAVATWLILALKTIPDFAQSVVVVFAIVSLASSLIDLCNSADEYLSSMGR